MKVLLTVFLLFSFDIFSQNLEKLQKTDVLFIIHNGINGNFQSKTILQKFEHKRASISYDFFASHQNSLPASENKITLVYSHYYDFDEEINMKPTPYFRVNKSFLRKNKQILITNKFIKKIRFIEFTKLIKNAKTIFLIDKSEKYNRDITIKEVRYFELSLE